MAVISPAQPLQEQHDEDDGPDGVPDERLVHRSHGDCAQRDADEARPEEGPDIAPGSMPAEKRKDDDVAENEKWQDDADRRPSAEDLGHDDHVDQSQAGEPRFGDPETEGSAAAEKQAGQ